MSIKGVFETKKKDGSVYYRTSITYRSKHISLGSFDKEKEAGKAYELAKKLIAGTDSFEKYSSYKKIPFDKFVILLNFRDNGIYFTTPIYLHKMYFEYYLSQNDVLKFDRDDLFFYASHKIQQKGGYLFVSEFGAQYKILGRYNIKPFSVYGRDYIMINGDKLDMRYSNIKIINEFTGVQLENPEGAEINPVKHTVTYKAIIHLRGNLIIGRFDNEVDAAIAYNKAVDTLHENGIKKAFIKNYITSIKKEEYEARYNKIIMPENILNATPL